MCWKLLGVGSLGTRGCFQWTTVTWPDACACLIHNTRFEGRHLDRLTIVCFSLTRFTSLSSYLFFPDNLNPSCEQKKKKKTLANIPQSRRATLENGGGEGKKKITTHHTRPPRRTIRPPVFTPGFFIIKPSSRGSPTKKRRELFEHLLPPISPVIGNQEIRELFLWTTL